MIIIIRAAKFKYLIFLLIIEFKIFYFFIFQQLQLNSESFNYVDANGLGMFDKTPIVVLEKSPSNIFNHYLSLSNNNNSSKTETISSSIPKNSSLNSKPISSPLTKMSSSSPLSKVSSPLSKISSSINQKSSTKQLPRLLVQLKESNDQKINSSSKNFDVYIKKIIDNPKTTIVQQDITSKIVKMIVNMPNRKQKLVQFDLIGDCTPVYDLLKYIEVPLTNPTKIYFVNDSILDINYVVETDTHVDYIDTLYNINNSPAECPNCKLILKNIDECFECEKKFNYDVRLIPKNSTNIKKKIIMSVAENFYQEDLIAYENENIDSNIVKDNSIDIVNENLTNNNIVDNEKSIKEESKKMICKQSERLRKKRIFKKHGVKISSGIYKKKIYNFDKTKIITGDIRNGKKIIKRQNEF